MLVGRCKRSYRAYRYIRLYGRAALEQDRVRLNSRNVEELFQHFQIVTNCILNGTQSICHS